MRRKEKRLKVSEVSTATLLESKFLVGFGNSIRIYDYIETPLEEVTKGHFISDIMRILPGRIRFAMMIIVLEGTLQASIDTRKYVIHRNHVLIATPGSIIDTFSWSADARLAAITLSGRTGLAVIPKPLIHIFIERFSTSKPIYVDDVTCNMLMNTYECILYLLKAYDFPLKQDTINGYVHVLACLIGQALAAQGESTIDAKSTDRKDSLLQDFLINIRQYVKESRQISFYAGKACLSPKHFAKSILAASGKHPAQIIQDYVILYAKALLCSEGRSVEETSQELGFVNASYFGRYFKNATGLSPLQYRQNNGKED